MISASNGVASSRAWIIAILVMVCLGIFLRVHSFETLKGVGFDENIYSSYVEYLERNGLLSYPELVSRYYEQLKVSPIVFLPPTRVSFLVASLGWQKVAGGPAVEAVRAISCLSAIVILLISGIFAWRLGGERWALGVTALMALAPTQVSMSHRALIDGFFGMVALLVIWSLWELLQNPKSRLWIWTYGVSLCLIVLTKENAAFVFFSVVGLLVVNRWMQFGELRKATVVATFAGPLAGALLLALCAGGFSLLVSVYQLNVKMNGVLPYGILNQDGPWFRYLSDLLLVSPTVLIFAIGGAFTIARKDKAALFLLLFIVFSYVVMGNLRCGMNLRFANMWDFPLRWLALVPIFGWAELFSTPARRNVFFFVSLGVLCLFEFSNYLTLFVDHQVYDPVPRNVMQALDMIK